MRFAKGRVGQLLSLCVPEGGSVTLFVSAGAYWCLSMRVRGGVGGFASLCYAVGNKPRWESQTPLGQGTPLFLQRRVARGTDVGRA